MNVDDLRCNLSTLSRTDNAAILRDDVIHVLLLTIKISQWARKSFESYCEIIDWQPFCCYK